MPAVYQITRDEVITAGISLCQSLGEGETISSGQITTSLPFLQMLLKFWETKGYNTWLYKTINFPAIAARSTGYTIGSSGADVVQDRPVRIAQAYTRDASGNDNPLIPIARNDYELLTPKAAVGPPNSFYYDRGVPADLKGIFYPWPILPDTSLTFYCLIQRPILDLTASGVATFDIEQSWQLPLVWNFAEQIMGIFGTEENQCKRIENNARRFLEEVADFTQEDASVQFTPSQRGGGLRGRR